MGKAYRELAPSFELEVYGSTVCVWLNGVEIGRATKRIEFACDWETHNPTVTLEMDLKELKNSPGQGAI